VSETVTLFDIQARLSADTDGSARRAIEAELAELQRGLRRRIDAGVKPDEFRRLTALADAAQAASEIVVRTWSNFHGTQK
jgi:hypothetical protein